MTFEEAYRDLELKFSSGNAIPVERAIILRTEWEAIKIELDRLKEIEFMYEDLQQ